MFDAERMGMSFIRSYDAGSSHSGYFETDAIGTERLRSNKTCVEEPIVGRRWQEDVRNR